MSTKELLNSPILWAATLAALCCVLFQIFIIVKKTLATAKMLNIGNDRIIKAVRASALTAIGPSVVGAATAVPLAIAIGTALALLRVMVIGSPDFELIAAQMGFSALSVPTGELPTPEKFLAVVAAIAFSLSVPIPLMIIFAGSMDKIRVKMMGKNNEGGKSFAALFSVVALIASMFVLNAKYVMKVTPSTYSWISGVVSMLIMEFIFKKKPMPTLQSLSLLFASIIGLTVTILFGLV